jgi:hypothetical protein
VGTSGAVGGIARYIGMPCEKGFSQANDEWRHAAMLRTTSLDKADVKHPYCGTVLSCMARRICAGASESEPPVWANPRCSGQAGKQAGVRSTEDPPDRDPTGEICTDHLETVEVVVDQG